MRIIPEYNDTAAIDLTVYLNPNPESRNLEFDPDEGSHIPLIYVADASTARATILQAMREAMLSTTT